MWNRCIFEFCGVPVTRRRTFNILVTSTNQQRAAWLNEAKALVTEAIADCGR